MNSPYYFLDQNSGTSDNLSVQKSYEIIYKQSLKQTQTQPQQTYIDHLNIIIDKIYDAFLLNLCVELQKYKNINRLTITLRDITSTKELLLQLELLGLIIMKQVKTNHIILKKQGESIKNETFLHFIQQFQSYLTLNKLSIIMINLNIKYDPLYEYSLKLFGQELGMFDSLNELNINLKNYGITSDNIFYALSGLQHCCYLNKLNINLLNNNLSKDAIIILSSILVKCQNILSLKLALTISNNKTQLQVLQHLISSMKQLQNLSLSLELLFESNNENQQETNNINQNEQLEITENPNIITFKFRINYSKPSKKQDNKKSEQFGVEFIKNFKSMQKLYLDLSNYKECNLIEYGQAIEQCINLNSIDLILNISNEDQDSISQFSDSLKICKNIKLMNLTLRKCHDEELIELSNQIIQSCIYLETLKINLQRNLINKQMFEKLMEQISEIKYLKTLIIKIGLNCNKIINPKLFSQAIKNNQYLNNIKFDFSLNKLPKVINWEMYPNDRGYCGTYILNLYQQRTEKIQEIKQFVKQMSLGKVLKQNSRLVKIEFDYHNIYYTQTQNNEEYYRALSISSDEYDDY